MVITGAYVYIMANPSRTIYIGVTTNLERRVWEHKTSFLRGAFTTKYKLTKLVYIAEFSRLDDAIAWEKALKGKTRAKKLALIAEQNPRWNDLALNWYDPELLKVERAAHEAEGAARH